MSTTNADGHLHNRVGPIFCSGELASAAIEALEEDNPDKEFIIEDRTAYIRVVTDHECVINRKTMQEILGRPFEMQELEVILGSFSGQIQVEEEFMRFYFTKIM